MWGAPDNRKARLFRDYADTADTGPTRRFVR